MLEARVVETIAAGIDKVWPVISNFRGVSPGPGIDAVDFEGDGVGMTRHIKTPNGTIVERLESLDDDAYSFSYAIINADGPLPFSDYSSKVNLETTGDNETTVTWVGSFNSRGVPDDKAVEIASGIYKGLIQRARKAVA